MWKTGTISSPTTGNKFSYWAKVYDEPSEEFGINGGRVSKLTIRKVDSTTALFNYDRGLDVPATDDEVNAVLQIILSKFENVVN